MNPDSASGLNTLRTVTKIESQKKKAGRLNIYLDNEFAFGICADTFSHFQINVGQQLNDKQIQIIRQHEQFEQAREAAVKYLALRMRSRKELQQYLQRRQKFDRPISERVVRYCLERGYLDDRVFCETFIHDQLNLSSNGLQKIRRALLMKGIARDLIETAVNQLVKEEDQIRTALTLARKKAAALGNDPKRRDKIYRFLIQKGFQPGVVLKALQKTI